MTHGVPSLIAFLFLFWGQASPATHVSNIGRKRKLEDGQLPVASLVDSHVGVTQLAKGLGPHVYKTKSVRWVRALAAEELHKYKSVATPYGTVVENQSIRGPEFHNDFRRCQSNGILVSCHAAFKRVS